MSYEGYDQCICEGGHYFELDCSASFYEELACDYCGSKVAWQNDVDETNCDSMGRIPLAVLNEKFLSEPEVVETCNLKHQHITKHAVYRIPTREETDPLRTFTDYNGNTQLLKL